MSRPFTYRLWRSVFLLLVLSLLLSQHLTVKAQVPSQTRVHRPLPQTAPASTPMQQPRLKGIFEPVNYNQDLKLLDAFFVSRDEGWVSGAAGTILHTTDGGNTWTAQLGGDPQSQGVDIDHLFFLDRIHGWAQGYSHLYRTVDGQNWQEVGNDVRGNVVFISPTKGFRGYGSIYETLDGGRTWKQAFACATRVMLQGLTQQITCGVNAIQFATSLIGYGVGDSSVLGGGVVVKTEDGGSTWNVIYLSPESGDQRTEFVSFLDESRGFAFRNAGLYRTVDGGRSWQGAAAPPSNAAILKFADPEVGWACNGTFGGFKLIYTTDSGSHWSSREAQSPAPVHGFSLPTRDRAYLVGEHGLIYRYRIVPIDYTVANMIPAPLMPGYDSPLNGELATVRSRASALAAQMQASLGISAPQQLINYADVTSASSTDGSAQYAAANSSSQSAPPTGFQQPMQTSGQYAAQGAFPQSTSSSLTSDAAQVGFQQVPQTPQPSADPSAFQQDTGTSSTNAAPGSQQPPFVSTGPGANQSSFQQTAGQPAAGVVASCCGSTLQTLESAANVFATDLPMFSGKFRNLNLITAGLQFINDLLQRTTTLKLAINNLRQAPDKQSAAAALGALSGQLNGIPADVNGGFVQDTSSAFPPQAQVPTSFAGAAQPLNQPAGNQPASGQPSAQQPKAQPPSAQPAQAANPSDQLNKATQTLKDKLKKKLPW